MTTETNQVGESLAFHHVADLARRLGGYITIYDLETTTFRGFSNFGIMEVSCFTVMPDGRGMKYGSLINPERNISPEASAVTGLTDRDVIKAETWGKRYAELFVRLANDHWLGGFNNQTFDNHAVKDMNKRYGHPIEEFKKTFDVLRLHKALSGTKSRRGNLAEVAELYGVKPRGALHRAAADVALTLETLNAIIELYGIDAVVEQIQPKQDGAFDRLTAQAVAKYVKSKKSVSLEQLAKDFGKETQAASFEVSKAIDERLVDPNVFAVQEAQDWLSEALLEVESELLLAGRLRPLHDALLAQGPDKNLLDYVQLRVALVRAGLAWASLKPQ